MKAVWMLPVLMMVALTACTLSASQANDVGNASFASKNYEIAVDSYQRAQDIEPSRSEIPYNSGNAYYKLRDFEQAREQFQIALVAADPDIARDSLFNLGNTSFENFEFELALEAYKEVLRLDYTDLDAKHNLELTLMQLQRISEAERQDLPPDEDGPPDQDDEPDQDEEDQPKPEQPDQSEEPEEDEQAGEKKAPLISEEQAEQLLDSIGQNTESLRGHLEQVFIVQKDPPAQDW